MAILSCSNNSRPVDKWPYMEHLAAVGPSIHSRYSLLRVVPYMGGGWWGAGRGGLVVVTAQEMGALHNSFIL